MKRATGTQYGEKRTASRALLSSRREARLPAPARSAAWRTRGQEVRRTTDLQPNGDPSALTLWGEDE